MTKFEWFLVGVFVGVLVGMIAAAHLSMRLYENPETPLPAAVLFIV